MGGGENGEGPPRMYSLCRMVTTWTLVSDEGGESPWPQTEVMRRMQKLSPFSGVALGNCPSLCAKTFAQSPKLPSLASLLQFNLNGVPHVIPSLCPFPGLTTVLDNLASVWTVALTSQAREESRPGKGGRVEFLFFPSSFFFLFLPS